MGQVCTAEKCDGSCNRWPQWRIEGRRNAPLQGITDDYVEEDDNPIRPEDAEAIRDVMTNEEWLAEGKAFITEMQAMQGPTPGSVIIAEAKARIAELEEELRITRADAEIKLANKKFTGLSIPIDLRGRFPLPLPVIRMLTMQAGRIAKLREFARFVSEWTAPDGTHYHTRALESAIALDITTGYSDFRKARASIDANERDLAPKIRRLKSIKDQCEDMRLAGDKKGYEQVSAEVKELDAFIRGAQAEIERCKTVVDSTTTRTMNFPADLAGCVFEVL